LAATGFAFGPHHPKVAAVPAFYPATTVTAPTTLSFVPSAYVPMTQQFSYTPSAFTPSFVPAYSPNVFVPSNTFSGQSFSTQSMGCTGGTGGFNFSTQSTNELETTAVNIGKVVDAINAFRRVVGGLDGTFGGGAANVQLARKVDEIGVKVDAINTRLTNVENALQQLRVIPKVPGQKDGGNIIPPDFTFEKQALRQQNFVTPVVPPAETPGWAKALDAAVRLEKLRGETNQAFLDAIRHYEQLLEAARKQGDTAATRYEFELRMLRMIASNFNVPSPVSTDE